MEKLNNEITYFYKGLGTSIIIDLKEGHTVFASAKYITNGFYNVNLAVCVTPEKRNTYEDDSMPIYNVFLKDMKLYANRNSLKTELTNKVVSMFKQGMLDDAISEIDIINKILDHSEQFIDKLISESEDLESTKLYDTMCEVAE